MNTKQFINAFLPRFLVEDVAFEEREDGYYIICPYWLLDDGERYDAIGKIKSFNLFGWALFPHMVGQLDKTPGYKK